MELVSFEDAIEQTLRGVVMLSAERVALEQAHRRVLAEDIIAATAMPPFSYSAMDGYAVRASFFTGDGPWELSVAGESRAGGPDSALRPGAACRIFTGAQIPRGANAVIQQEAVSRPGPHRIAIPTKARPHEGQNIRPRGADLAQGATALSSGTLLTAGKLGLAAGLERARLLVGRKPIVTLMSTGDELRAPGEPGPVGSIPESNSYVIGAIARRAGALVRAMPLVADDPTTTETQLRRALRSTDLLVTIGGASVGDHDLVRPALNAVGASIDFWGVAIKPGKPLGLASFNGAKILGLPGNPASAVLTFILFGVPLLRAMQGHSEPRPRRVPLRVIGSHVHRLGRDEFLRARLELHDGELCAVLPTSQSSGAVTSFAGADALVILAADRPRIDNGDQLPAILLADVWS